MKVLLVTRGSSGDILPYLSLATELQKRGHDAKICLPRIFEEEAISHNVNYTLQDFDDINGMINDASQEKVKFRTFIKWTRDVIDKQFSNLIPLVQETDLFISTNTEFAAASIAEYCNKPFIRTAYAPFLPGKKISPPIFPHPKPNPILTPLLWKALNISTHLMVAKALNKNREQHQMPRVNNFGIHAAKNAQNLMLYSPVLGCVDPDWKFRWDISGYCFNDIFHYDQNAYQELMNFIKKDSKTTLFFTLGSCTSAQARRFVDMLSEICRENDYKLVIGSGWSKTGLHLEGNNHLFLMKKAIPHSLIFSACDAIMHHGGCGTTHNVARSGKPQLITPLIIDQHFWSYRTHQLGLGPKKVNIGKVTKKQLEEKIRDLVTNPEYKKNAAIIAEKLNSENGIKNFCDYIEDFWKKHSETLQANQ